MPWTVQKLRNVVECEAVEDWIQADCAATSARLQSHANLVEKPMHSPTNKSLNNRVWIVVLWWKFDINMRFCWCSQYGPMENRARAP